ncbi:MAG TPA: SWIM zinc finger family protein [Kofleriaceae bacterium]|nr:SWIM zinc finger family protein [Kofleriaceae bacterium]
MVTGGIATILHRSTLAVMVGNRTFERGERCFTEGRVGNVVATRGELRGLVRPSEPQRREYAVRIWVRDDGIAFECTCPIGQDRQFCKHAIAIALAHLARDTPEREHAALRSRLAALPQGVLVDALLREAREDPAMLELLHRLCDDAG